MTDSRIFMRKIGILLLLCSLLLIIPSFLSVNPEIVLKSRHADNMQVHHSRQSFFFPSSSSDVYPSRVDISSIPKQFRVDLLKRSKSSDILDHDMERVVEKKQDLSQQQGTYISHGPIYISSDADFASQAQAEGWPGNGTSENPYIIEGYNLTGSASALITISSVTVHFIIRNNFISGSSSQNGIGIQLINVTNGQVIDNIIKDTTTRGISIDTSQQTSVMNNTVQNVGCDLIAVSYSHHIQIMNNTVHDSIDCRSIYLFRSNSTIVQGNVVYNVRWGILLDRTFNNTILNNTAFALQESGIAIYFSTDILVSKNVVSDARYAGILLSSQTRMSKVINNIAFDNGNNIVLNGGSNFNIIEANHVSGAIIRDPSNPFGLIRGSGIYLETNLRNNTIRNNFIHDNEGSGIDLCNDVDKTMIVNNSIWNNGRHGIHSYCGQNDDTYIIQNSISQNAQVGIQLEQGPSSLEGSKALIQNNTIYKNSNGGIAIYMKSTTIKDNNVLFNHAPQAYDVFSLGINVWDGNFWSDHDSVDADGDGFFDDPYIISGPSSSRPEDFHPRTEPLHLFTTIHVLWNLQLIFPSGSDTLRGTITIQWRVPFDSQDHELQHSLYLSRDGGLTWEPLVENLNGTTNTYPWNTTTVPDGDTYRLKVVTTCSEGLKLEVKSPWNLKIDNIPDDSNDQGGTSTTSATTTTSLTTTSSFTSNTSSDQALNSTSILPRTIVVSTQWSLITSLLPFMLLMVSNGIMTLRRAARKK